jgi:hypothetical protein
MTHWDESVLRDYHHQLFMPTFSQQSLTPRTLLHVWTNIHLAYVVMIKGPLVCCQNPPELLA